jgi:hypothetical protein
MYDAPRLEVSRLLKVSEAHLRQLTNQASGLFHTFPDVHVARGWLVIGTFFLVFEYHRSMFTSAEQTPPPGLDLEGLISEGPLIRGRKRKHEESTPTLVFPRWAFVNPIPLCHAESMVDHNGKLTPEFVNAMRVFLLPQGVTFSCEPSFFDWVEERRDFDATRIVSESTNSN